MKALLLLLLSAVAVAAQEHPFRYVDGKRHDLRALFGYYRATGNVTRPVSDWQKFSGLYVERTKQGVVLREFTTKDIYETIQVQRRLDPLSRSGLSQGGAPLPPPSPIRRLIGTETNLGAFFHVANLQREADVDLIAGQVVEFVALPLAHPYRNRSSQIKAYDHGTLPTPEQQQEIAAFLKEEAETTAAIRKAVADKTQADKESKAAATDVKVLAAQKKRAESGDAQGQYDLALRHLSGKGVAKDEKEASRLLKLAAAQGHKPAQKQLEGMKPATP